MARYQLIIAYDGTDYHGFQRQKDKRTLQGVIEAALCKVGWKDRSILAAGRTDMGVHASGQVIAFDLDWRHSPAELVCAINAYLPLDVAVRSGTVVAPSFHPRFDAMSRSYRYRIFFDPVRNPLRERFGWRVWPELDLERLQLAAILFQGVHDFSLFGSPVKTNGLTTRQVFASTWKKSDDWIEYRITANAFLYHMVRRLVYQQVQVGANRLELDLLEKGLNKQDLDNHGLAPASGLELERVYYQEI